MEAITHDRLHVECSLTLTKIHSFSFCTGLGEHAQAYLTGSVEKEKALQCIRQGMEKEWVEIKVTVEKGGIARLFVGCIQQAELFEEEESSRIALKAFSSTCLLDQEKKSRSFQDTDLTYEALIRQIIADYQDTDLVFHANDKKIGTPVIQYEETDWELIRRLASHLNTAVTADCRTKAPMIHIGFINNSFKDHALGKPYQICAHQDQKPFYRIRRMDHYQLGDKIPDAGAQNVICLKKAVLEKEILEFEYEIGNEDYVKRPRYNSPLLRGLTLSGTVIQTDREKIKLHLDLDHMQDKSKAYDFPWRPITGNLFYNMPECGEKAALYIPDGEEGNAIGVYAIRQSENIGCEMDNPSNRYYTAWGGRQYFAEQERMGFLTQKNESRPLELLLEDTQGITIRADQSISILAEKQLTLRGKKVVLRSPKEATLVKKDLLKPTAINLCNAFDAIGASGDFAGNDAVTVKDKQILVSKRIERYQIKGAVLPLVTSIPVQSGNDKSVRCALGSMPLF